MRFSRLFSRASLFSALLFASNGSGQSITDRTASDQASTSIPVKNPNLSDYNAEQEILVTPASLPAKKITAVMQPVLYELGNAEIQLQRKRDYVASVDLAHIFGRKTGKTAFSASESNVIIGLKRPYYRLGEKTRVIGLVDFKLSKHFAGLGNSAVVSVRYDLRGDTERRKVDLSLLLDLISYRMTIPVGGQ